jgi:CO/xanthine dehydrogenase Mo-binding subunit
MANKLVGQNYSTPDLVAKVTGKAKYAEDFRAEGHAVREAAVQPDAARASDTHRHERGARDAGRQSDPDGRRSAGRGRGREPG